MQFAITKLKVELKLAINRLRLLQAKKSSLNTKARREIASLLEIGKVESAYVRVENIIREDFNIEALEILELYCELLNARLGLIEQSRTVDPGIEDAVVSVAYASARVDVKELVMIRELLAAKYGAEFIKNATDNVDGTANPKLVHKLSVKAPARYLVEMYLKEIASVYNVSWRPDGEDEDNGSDDEDTPSGGVRELVPPISELATPPPASPSSETRSRTPRESGQPDGATESAAVGQASSTGDSAGSETLPSVPSSSVGRGKSAAGAATKQSNASDKPKTALPSASGDSLPSLDELQKRFEALKRR